MKLPALSLANPTVPVGGLTVPGLVSLIDAVQVVGWPATTPCGAQSSDVDVYRFVIAIPIGDPTRIGLSGVFVASAIGVTVLSPESAT